MSEHQTPEPCLACGAPGPGHDQGCPVAEPERKVNVSDRWAKLIAFLYSTNLTPNEIESAVILWKKLTPLVNDIAKTRGYHE
jgi:hypothetical protein